MSLRELQQAASVAIAAAELARQRFTAASLRVYVCRLLDLRETSSATEQELRRAFEDAAKAHLEAQDQVRKALGAVDQARQLARQRREVRRAGR